MKPLFAIPILVIVLCPWFAHAGGIEILYYAHVEPYVSDTGGRVSGPAIEIVNRVMAEAGNPLTNESYRYIAWARALAHAEIEEGKGVVGLIITPQRKDHFKWVGPIGEVSLGLWASKSRHIRPKIFQELHMYTIGVVRNSAPEQVLTNECNFTTDQFERLRSEDAQIRMLQEGRVDMIVLSELGAGKAFRRMGLDPEEYEQVWLVTNSPFYLALNKATDDELVTRLQEALDKLKIREPGQATSKFQEIYDSYR